MIYTKDVQYHIGLKEGDIGKYIILTGDPGRCEYIANYLEDSKKIAQNREYTTYTGFLNGERISVVSTGIGGPSAAIALEELIRIGANTFVRVGTAGGLDIEVLGGDLVIANGAIRMEGTTKEYIPIEFPAVANHEITSALIKSAKNLANRYHVGIVECKDSFYGQHEPEKKPISYELINKRNAWIEGGALASEMESAALFIVGQIYKVRVGTVLTVIANQVRRQKGLEDIQVYDNDSAIKVAIDAMKNLISEDKK